MDHRVLPRTPDLLDGFLGDQVDIDRLVGETADGVPPLVDRVFRIDLESAENHQSGPADRHRKRPGRFIGRMVAGAVREEAGLAGRRRSSDVREGRVSRGGSAG